MTWYWTTISFIIALIGLVLTGVRIFEWISNYEPISNLKQGLGHLQEVCTPLATGVLIAWNHNCALLGGCKWTAHLMFFVIPLLGLIMAEINVSKLIRNILIKRDPQLEEIEALNKARLARLGGKAEE